MTDNALLLAFKNNQCMHALGDHSRWLAEPAVVNVILEFPKDMDTKGRSWYVFVQLVHAIAP